MRETEFRIAILYRLGIPVFTKDSDFYGCGGRPSDVMIRAFASGLNTRLDISIFNPMQVQTVARAAEEIGYGLTLRHNQKWSKYGDKCLAEGIKFCLIIV